MSTGVSLSRTCSRMAVFSSTMMMSYRCVDPSCFRDGEWILSRRVMLYLRQHFTHLYTHKQKHTLLHTLPYQNCPHFITSHGLGKVRYSLTQFKSNNGIRPPHLVHCGVFTSLTDEDVLIIIIIIKWGTDADSSSRSRSQRFSKPEVINSTKATRSRGERNAGDESGSEHNHTQVVY